MASIPSNTTKEIIRLKIRRDLQLEKVTVTGSQEYGVEVRTSAPALLSPESVEECVVGIKKILKGFGFENGLVTICHSQTA